MFVSGHPPAAGTKTGMSSPPMFPHEMRNKNNPMRRRRLGLRLGKNALEKRNSPAGTARGERADASGSCAFQARSMRGAFPKRALRVAHGVTFVSPRRGAGKSLKLKGKFAFADFEEATSKRSVEPCRLLKTSVRIRVHPWFQKKSAEVCGSCGEKVCAGGFRKAAGMPPLP